MILIIDNYDSFVYNLAQYFGTVDPDIEVIRNDRIDENGVKEKDPDLLVISPGPGRPETSGNIVEIIRAAAGEIPVFGVCLGHQAIGYAFGAEVVHATSIMHGKTSEIHHDGKGVFTGIQNPFTATRYHSLIVQRKSLPDCFDITAESSDKVVMGIRHREFAVEGVQFHPESLSTREGMGIVENVCRMRKTAS
jgi:para-aminobenzoate synthetase component 2